MGTIEIYKTLSPLFLVNFWNWNNRKPTIILVCRNGYYLHGAGVGGPGDPGNPAGSWHEPVNSQGRYTQIDIKILMVISCFHKTTYI